ncbi:MAG: hypothetical protein IJT47_04975 [Selenomonadaceae bacterium]|nr:hypothetical protein [Selenomonadaceae bacterium]
MTKRITRCRYEFSTGYSYFESAGGIKILLIGTSFKGKSPSSSLKRPFERPIINSL